MTMTLLVALVLSAPAPLPRRVDVESPNPVGVWEWVFLPNGDTVEFTFKKDGTYSCKDTSGGNQDSHSGTWRMDEDYPLDLVWVRDVYYKHGQPIVDVGRMTWDGKSRCYRVHNHTEMTRKPK